MRKRSELLDRAQSLELERLRPIPSQHRLDRSCGPHCRWDVSKVRHCGCVDCHGRPR